MLASIMKQIASSIGWLSIPQASVVIHYYRTPPFPVFFHKKKLTAEEKEKRKLTLEELKPDEMTPEEEKQHQILLERLSLWMHFPYIPLPTPNREKNQSVSLSLLAELKQSIYSTWTFAPDDKCLFPEIWTCMPKHVKILDGSEMTDLYSKMMQDKFEMNVVASDEDFWFVTWEECEIQFSTSKYTTHYAALPVVSLMVW